MSKVSEGGDVYVNPQYKLRLQKMFITIKKDPKR